MFEIERLINIKTNLALNKLQRLICHKPKQKQKKCASTQARLGVVFYEVFLHQIMRYQVFLSSENHLHSHIVSSIPIKY